MATTPQQYARRVRRKRKARKPETWHWRDHFSSAALPQLGAINLAMLRDPARWVHRRVESIEFLDERYIRREIHLDFTLPSDLPTPLSGHGHPLAFVPVAMVPRQAAPPGGGEYGIMRSEARNDAGVTLPLVTEPETTMLTAIALSQYARKILQAENLETELQGDLGRELLRIPFRSFDANLPVLRQLVSPATQEWHNSKLSRPARKLFAKDPDFVDFLMILAANSPTIVPVSCQLGTRQLVSLSYDLDTKWVTFEGLSRLKALARRIGYAPAVTSIPLSLTGGAKAHSLQLTLPQNLELTEVDMATWRPLDLVRPLVCGNPGDPRPPAAYRAFVSGFERRSHIHIEHAQGVTSGTLLVGMRAERQGVLTGSVIAAALVTLVLAGYWVFADQVVNGSTAGITALLLAPGLIAAFLVRAGEHAVVRRLLVFPRVALALSGALTVVAAAVLEVLGPPSKATVIALRGTHLVELPPHYTAPTDLKTALGIIAALALLFFLLLLGSHFLPLRGKRPTTLPEPTVPL